MKKTIAIIAMVMVAGMVGQVGAKYPSKPETSRQTFTITITPAKCPEGYERVNQTIYGAYRRGCYPIDFDYKKANKRFKDHLELQKGPK